MNDDELNVLRFKVSNLTTEKEVANAEIDRLKEANEHWHTIVSFHKTDMDAVTDKLTAERESKVAARGEVDRLRKQIGTANAEVKRLRDALTIVTEGKGEFSLDRFQHCKNTVADMKEVAKQALADHSYIII